jgi:reverse gyrase
MYSRGEKTVSHLTYYPNEAISACALCGGDVGTVYFKNKLICEECLNLVKELY